MDYYVDPILLDSITYMDTNGKRRVKNPYRNRRSYDILIPGLNSEGNFVMKVPEDIIGKSVFVDFPAKTPYRFTVSASTRELTVIGIPLFTYIEVHVVNPRPLPQSDIDLIWDDLLYDSQKAIMAAWGDIDLICNVLYPASAESELNFDDQNTLKYGLIGFRNNCGNLRNAGWGYRVLPKNGSYFPPQPIPTPAPTPDPPAPVDPEIGHDYDLKFVLRWENGSRADLDMHCFLDHKIEQRVWYAKKEYGTGVDRMWLDFDYVSHDPDGRAAQPEVITVLGFKSSTVSLQINNFNRGIVTETVTLEILNEQQNVLKAIQINASALSGQKSYWVCDVDLGTKAITDKKKQIASVGTFS